MLRGLKGASTKAGKNQEQQLSRLTLISSHCDSALQQQGIAKREWGRGRGRGGGDGGKAQSQGENTEPGEGGGRGPGASIANWQAPMQSSYIECSQQRMFPTKRNFNTTFFLQMQGGGGGLGGLRV